MKKREREGVGKREREWHREGVGHWRLQQHKQFQATVEQFGENHQSLLEYEFDIFIQVSTGAVCANQISQNVW